MCGPMHPNPILTSPILTSPVNPNPILTNPILTSPMHPNPILTNPMHPNPIPTNPMHPNPMPTSPNANALPPTPQAATCTQQRSPAMPAAPHALHAEAHRCTRKRPPPATVTKHPVSALRPVLALLTAMLPIGVACGDEATTKEPPTTAEQAPNETEQTPTTAGQAPTDGQPGTPIPWTPDMPEPTPGHLGDSSQGVVRVTDGEDVQIRILGTLSGIHTDISLANQRSVEQAVADYGPIHGFDVSTGTSLDGGCTASGGRAAAETIAAREAVVGVVSTSPCADSEAAAAPLITAAGMVMLSSSNTSPPLTSDLNGSAGAEHESGYYRIAHNDLYQGVAMAHFAYRQLGLPKTAAIHEGDLYSQGLALAFAASYQDLGGTITGVHRIDATADDMAQHLEDIASGEPAALFFPVSQSAGDSLIRQLSDTAGLEDAFLLTADSLLDDAYLGISETEGVYLSSPDTRYADSVNSSTGATADDILTRYEARWGEQPTTPFWAHSYDAAAVLLDAITAAAHVQEDGTLVIDRAGVREHLDTVGSVSAYRGLTGMIECGEYGDCGAGRITIIQHLDSNDPAASNENIVYDFSLSY